MIGEGISANFSAVLHLWILKKEMEFDKACCYCSYGYIQQFRRSGFIDKSKCVYMYKCPCPTWLLSYPSTTKLRFKTEPFSAVPHHRVTVGIRPTNCPLEGKCRESSIIYKATLKFNGIAGHYYGCNETEFKTRFNNHKQSLVHRHKRNATELLKAVCNA